VSPFLWSGRSIVKRGTNKLFLAPICDVLNVCYPRAIDTLWASSDLLKTYCSDCSPQCSITDFIVQKSSLAAPPEWQLESIKAFVENSSVPLPTNWSTTWREDIYRDYVSVRIIRETSMVENYTQSATMNIVDVLSNIGGQTGLWIGISFLSIMELIEMLYRLVRYQYFVIRRVLRNKREIGGT
jgi:hypothetical protein